MKKLLAIISALGFATAAYAMDDTNKRLLDGYIKNMEWGQLSLAIGRNQINLYDLLSYDASALDKKDTNGLTLCDELVYLLANSIVITYDTGGYANGKLEETEEAIGYYEGLQTLICAGKITLSNQIQQDLTAREVDVVTASLCNQYCDYIRNQVIHFQGSVPGYITANNWSELAAFMTANHLPPPACSLSLSQVQNASLISAFTRLKNDPTIYNSNTYYIDQTIAILTDRTTFAQPATNPQGATPSWLSVTPKTYLAIGAVAIAGLLMYSYYRTAADDETDDIKDETDGSTV